MLGTLPCLLTCLSLCLLAVFARLHPRAFPAAPPRPRERRCRGSANADARAESRTQPQHEERRSPSRPKDSAAAAQAPMQRLRERRCDGADARGAGGWLTMFTPRRCSHRGSSTTRFARGEPGLLARAGSAPMRVGMAPTFVSNTAQGTSGWSTGMWMAPSHRRSSESSNALRQVASAAAARGEEEPKPTQGVRQAAAAFHNQRHLRGHTAQRSA